MNFIRCLKSEALKTKHTILSLLIIISPLLFSSCVLMYYYGRVNANNTATMTYRIHITILQLIGGLVVPVATGICVSIMTRLEYRAGNFQNVLKSPCGKMRTMLTKITLVLLIEFFVVMLCALLIFTFSNLIYGLNLGFKMTITIMLIMVLSSIPMVVFYQCVGYLSGMWNVLIVSIAGMLTAAIIGTTQAGDECWQFIPFSYPNRVPNLVLNTNITGSYNGEAISLLAQNQLQSLMPCLIFVSLAMIIICLVFIWKWNVRNKD